MASVDLDTLLDKSPSAAQHPCDELSNCLYDWISERAAPELLHFSASALHLLTTLIAQQTQIIEELQNTSGQSALHHIILSTELERAMFILRSFIRTRLFKIDAHRNHYIGTVNADSNLTELEQQYCAKHDALITKHLQSLLRELPESGQLRSLTDRTAAGVDMVAGPDLRRAVFCRVTQSIRDKVRIGTDELEMQDGDTMLVSYETIRQFVKTVECLQPDITDHRA